MIGERRSFYVNWKSFSTDIGFLFQGVLQGIGRIVMLLNRVAFMRYDKYQSFKKIELDES